MIRPKNETEDSLLSVTKNCETLFKQTHRKAEETLEFKITKPKEKFSFQPSIILGTDSNWVRGLISLDVYNCVFNITEDNYNFEI